MPTISFSGLSSGIDSSGWVDALVSVRQQTITSLQEQQEAQEALLNVVNEIKSYFSSFQSCLSKITDSQFGIPTMDLFMQNLAVSSNTNIATATATTEAARQSYDVVVDSLATATKATSGYNQYEVKYATLDTQIGLLGAKNGTITVNQQSFSVTTEDTIRSLIQKFQNVGVSAEFNEQKGTFTVGVSLSEIDEGATNIKSALKLQDNTVSGAISGSLVYADRDTEFSKLGLTDGKVMIEGVEHTITQNGNNYTITKAGGTAANLNTVGDFLDYLMSSAVGAESADVDDMGNISIKGATLDAVTGGSNIIDVLNLSETFNRTAMESNRLTYIDVHVADLNTKLSDMGINATTTLTVGGNTHNITQDMTLGDIQNLLAAGNVDFEIDDKGVITIDTKGNEISGTLLDVLGLDPSKNGSTITSTAHESHYDADGNTLLSDLGVNNSHNYVAYDSEGKALTGNINNVSGKTINELIEDLRNAGLDASFDDTTHQIVINDGYIEGTLADALGMNKNTTSYTESATLNTTLEKLGATGNETLTIDGGAAKTYGKDTTLETVLNDIKAAGGDVTFKDGNVTIQGVTLGGTLPALLGLDATTQGTSVTSGALTVVTDSSSSGSDMDATIEHDITLSSKIGDILGTTSNYTLSVDGGAATTYTKDTTLQTLKNQIEAAGGTFTINDDNTISIEDVTMSGTLVGALGFDSVENGTRFSTVNPVYIPGATTVANGSTSLDELFGGASGISTFSAAPARAMAAPAAAPRAGGGYTLSIDGGTEISYAAGVTLDDIFADITAAGGSASIDSDGYIVIDGVHLEGTLVDALGLVETSYGTTITSGNLQVTESMTSTSSSTLMGEKEGNLSWDSTVGSITGDDKSYLMGINGTTHTYATDVKLSDIRDDIVAAGGSMTLNSDNTISITGVSIDGTLATALGFDVTDYKTTISSNTPVYAKTEDVEATASTTFNDLGINTNLRDYAIYLPDGTIVKASSEAGSSGTATIGDWLNEINNALNTANGTSGQTYAKIENGVISITGGGYVTGSLPTALGMLTEEVITGTTMVGSPISYIEYEPLKYITSIQNGTGESGKDITYTGSIGNATNQSGTAADGVTSDGLIGPEDEFVDLFGNITDATLNATLSELLTPGASDPLNNDARLPADSYTLKIGSYATKTFDSDTTTLQDVIDYVDTLKTYDPTYDMAFDAYLSGNKLVIKTDMDISGTLADVIGLTKVKTEDEYYTYVAKNIQYTALVEGASNGFNFSIVGDKVYYDKTETGTKDGYEYTGESISTTTTKTYVSSLSGFVSGETYYIKDANDLNKLAELVDAGKDTTNVSFILENDIDMSSVANFAGIGRVIDTAFKGNFYGNGHVIKNVTMNLESASQFVGFFGQTSGATIQDVGLENVNITSRHCAPSSFVGALIGKAFNTTIINSYVDGGTIDSSADYTAGLVARMSGASNLITNSWATVDISITSTTFAIPVGSNAGLTVGGLVGEFSGGTIKNSFSSSNITGSARASAGGLIGSLSGSSSTTITNVYADGDVSSSSSGVNVGGLIGYSGTGTITNAFYSGSTLSGTNVGGFIGASGGGLNILNSAYNSAANANAISGGSLSGVNPMTMESMTNQATMEGLGFTSDNGWVYTPGATPHLANATVTTIGVSLTTSTTIGQLFGDTNSHTLTVQVEGGSSKNITFSSTDTVQSVIDKLAAEGIDASVTADHRFKVFDESRWTLSGDVATKLFGGSGNDVYTYTGNKVTYTETVVTPGAGGNYNYTGESIQWEETITDSGFIESPSNVTGVGEVTARGFISSPVVKSTSGAQTVSSVSNFTSGSTYVIKTAADLNKLAELVNNGKDTTNVSFILENDIDMSSVSNFAGIGTYDSMFKGSFYGNGHVIRNLTMSGSSTNYVGFFNHIRGATIQDVGLEDVNISATSATSVGGLVGFMQNAGTIKNSYVKGGTITGANVGGLVGVVNDLEGVSSTIESSYTDVTVSGSGAGGGLVSMVMSGTLVTNIRKSFALGDVSGSMAAAGLVGGATAINIENSFAMGNITSSDIAGGLVGLGSGYITNTFYAGSSISGTSVGGVVGSTDNSISVGTIFATNVVYNTAAASNGISIGNLSGSASSMTMDQLTNQATMEGLGFTSANGWKFTSGMTPHFGNVTSSAAKTYVSSLSNFVAGETYYIKDANDLNKLAELVNNGADTTNVSFILENDIDMSSVANFAGIGSSSNEFRGNFYGNGHVIKNLTMNNSSGSGVGFFNNVYDGAIIQDLGLENVNVTGNADVGGLVGYATESVVIKNSYVTGNVTGYGNVGGLAGHVDNIRIESSYADVIVTGSNVVTGGLVGLIDNCFSNNNIITNSFAAGTVNGSHYAGGFAGVIQGGSIVSNSYTIAEVKGDDFVGGFVGQIDENSKVSTVYTYGQVSGNHKVGAFAGDSEASTVYTNALCIGIYTGGQIAGNGTANGVINLTFDQMKNQSTMEGMGFTAANGWVYSSGATPHFGNANVTTTGVSLTTSTTIAELFGDSNSHTLTVKVEGGTAKNITFSSTDTVQTVINKLAAEGITASVTSDHKFRVEADNRWTLSGEMAPKLFGGSGNQVYTCTGNKITYDETTTTPGTADPDGFIDAPDIHNPPSGGSGGSSGGTITQTEYYYQGSKVTYGGTSGTAYAASTKISDIRSSAVGTRWYVISDNYTGSTTGFVGQSAMFRYIDINANTTIQDVVDFFNSSAGVQSASYSTLTGEMSVTTQNGYQFHCSGVPFGTDVHLPAEGSGLATPGGTYKVAFGKSAGTPASTATLTTKLSDLGSFLPAGIGFSVTNNGATTDLTFSSTDTISTVVNKLNSLGLEASFLNGALRVSSSYSDFEITTNGLPQRTFVNKLFGGSLPSIQTNTTTIDPNAITESTTLGELGITSGTLSNNGISLVGGSVPERTFTSDNTLGDVFSYLEAGGATVTLNTDGTVSITGNAELSGDLLGQLGITLTSSKKTAVISSLTLTYGEKNLALSDRLSTLGLSGSYTIGTNGTTVLANSTVSNLLAALNGLNTSTSPSPGFGTVGGIGGGNIEGFHGGEYKNVSYDPTTGILEFTITGSGSAAYMPAGTLFSALDMVSRVQATDGSYDTTYQYRLTKPGTNVTTATTLKQIFGDTSTTTHTIKVNGQTGTFSSTDNMGDVIDWLNANVGTASLSAGHFSLEYTPTGSTGLLPGNMQGDLGLWISLKSAKGYETETVYNGTLTKVSGSTSGAQYVSDVDSFVSGETYLIKSVDDLNKLASLVNNGADTTNVSFILENDIDMSSVANFAGIGSSYNEFRGNFYGNGHVIKNLKMNSSAQYVGLFGYTRNATIQDVGLENVNITSTCTFTPSMTGALIAFSVTTDVKNVYVDGGSINSSTMYTGGLIGYINGEYIGTTASAPINITNSYSDVNININSSGSPSGHNTGGLIGASEGAPTSIIITNSFSSSDITGNSQNVGGLIGLGAGVSITITNAYADGNVSSTRTGSNVGGLIGQVQSGSVGTITNAFYSGSTLSGTNVGGFIGTDATSGGGLNILNSAYNSAANANAVSGGSLSGVNSMTMEQLTNQTIMQNMGFTAANGWVYTSGLTPHFGNMTGSAGSTTTVTKDATLSTTVGQLIDGYTTGTIIVNGGSNISVNSSTTIQDIIDAFNNQGIIATWNNGKISLEASSAVSITENNGLINKLFGSTSVSLTGSGGGSDSYTMETSIGSGGSTTTEITHDANLNTTVGQLVDGYSSGTITVSGGTNISVNSSTTIQDIIDKFNDQGIIASWNNGQISLESGTTVTISDSNGLISKLFGTSSVTLNPISSVSGSYTMDKVISGTGTTTNTYTMDASTTIGDLFGDSNSHTFTVNGNDITLSADKTVQDLINALAGYGVTATINDGKMTIGSNSDSLLTVSGDLANKVLGKTGSGSVSVDYETVEKTLSLSTTMSELFWDTNSHDFVITKENGSKTTISLSGNQTVQDLITKLQANGIVATLDSSGKLTFKSNYKWSVSGDLGNKVTEGVMNLTVTPLYTFESEELETYTGHQTVSQMLNSGQTLITGNRYHIASVDDLKALATFVNERGLDTTDIDFVLDGDLNLAGVSGLVPIGTQANAFKGNFYGNGHTISNLKISSTGNFVGLFGKVDGATIRDLGLENVDISGGSQVGALTGYAVDSTIENVYSTGKVTGTGDQVGGLIGDVNSSNVKNVYSTAEVEGNTNVGGLIGHLAHYSVLENVYATGDVRSSASQAGGLVGGVRYGGTIKNAYATGDVYGTQSLGGLVGLFEGVDGAYTYTLDTVYSTGRVVNGSVTGGILLNSGALLGNFANGAKVTVTNAVYNTDLEMAGIGSGSASGLTGLTYVEMQDASRMQGLGFTTAKGWKYISDKMTPVLNSVVVDNTGRTYSGEKLYVRGLTEFEAGDTYYIGTKEDLIRLSELVNAGEDTTGSVFILDGDIDMSGVDFAPIGNTSNAFRGDFYGNGHEISNLTINSSDYHVGLFGTLEGAHIQDVGLVDVSITANTANSTCVGALVGYAMKDSSVENVYVIGGSIKSSASATANTTADIGGLIGGANQTIIVDSYAAVDLNVTGTGVGGFIGRVEDDTTITNSYSTGTVNNYLATGSSILYTGGFAGWASGGNTSKIESSYSTGRVISVSGSAGGFIGHSHGIIDNSYATGFVEGSGKVGGFVGEVSILGATLTGNVYNQSTKLNAAGSGSTSGITGLELSQMWEKDTMEGLGFTADKGWNYTDNTTPFLNTNNTMVNGDKTYVRDAQSFDSGEVFYIGTAQDLQKLAQLVNNGAVTTGVTFVLDADITMSGTAFESIGTSAEKFNGVFMGNGHTISGLTTGLFGDVEDAIIRDVGLENVNINATANSTGALAGSAEGTTEIVNSYAKGTITSSKSNIGGLVGSLNSTSSIKSSYAEVNVTGSASVGGLVGLSAGTIENSSATGTVKALSSTAGGFVGRTTGGSITNSFAAGNVTASSAAGGFVGSASGTTITGSYAAGIVSGGSGFIGSVSGSNSFSGNVYNNANSAGAGGGTGVSIDDIKSQSKMEALGFTSDKGWVYYEGQAPQLRGKDTSKQYTVDASLDSILANLGSTTISKDITVEVNGTTQTKHFNDTDTVQDVMDWLNGISGVTAVFDEATSKLTISTDDGEMNVTGGLANTLFGGYANKVLDKITQNTDSSHLMAAGSDAIITEDTTVKQLLNSNNSASIGYIDEDGSTVMESFDPDQTLKEVLDWLNAHGFNASITNGVFTAVKEDGSQTDLLGAIGSALKGVDGTTTSTPSGYVSDVLTSVTGEKATGTTQLSALGIDSGNIHIQDASGKIVQTIQINNNMTVNDVATLLSAYGITMSINDGKVTVATDGPVKLVDGSSNMVSQMQLDNWIETKSKLTNTSTVAEMGFSQGASLGVIIDGRPTTISFRADDTLDDIITRLKTLGIEASVDADGKFTATSDKGFMLTDELGVYLTQNSVDGYVNFANGYKSENPVESPGNSTILTEDSLVGDILGTGEGGILRLTLDENNVVDLQYNADDTMQDIMVDLAAYGIETQIKNGVLTAVNLNRTFSFSGDIGKAISGNTPLYENIETGYISKDLSYETVETANMNSTMKELGILGGQIHILNSEGGMVTTLEVDESFTVSQIRSMLSPYGFNLTMDSNGKVSMTSSEGYSVSDGTSNLAAVMGLDNWNQTTEKLALDTTISEMGFKDGADLNLFLDGAVMNVLSFDADQTLQDVIFALSAYGIDASVDANGKFSAVSKDHTFIMSSTLGSFLTKGTSGYVNDDTGYQTVEALEEEKPYTVNSSEKLGYEKLMSADSTLASLGYENGGSVIVNLDGGTYYTLSFLGTDTVQDVIYALSPYGITAEVGADGKFNAVSTDHSFTLTGNVGNFLTSGGAYQNEVTGYETDPITFETTEKVTLDTKLSDLGVSHGDLNIMKDGKVTGSTINITDDTTVGQLFNAIKVYGMEGKIMTDTNGDTYIRISADSNTYLADGTANIVSGLGLVEIRQGDFEGNVIYWEDDTDSGLITEDMLLSTLDKNGYIAQGSLIFETGTGDEAVQHIINITADETVGSLIKKFQDAGINASLSNGVIKISSGLDGITFTGGTSGLVNTIGLDIEDVDVYASSSSALTYEGNVHYSAANYATGDTLLSIVNATEGDMSVFVDGVKCTIHVDPNQTFADLFAQISSTVAARTGLNIKAGFLDKEGNIVVNPTDDKNTGIVAFEIEEGHELVIGASNDTTNFATIANLNKTDFNQITGSRSLYRVNVNSLLTESGLYRDGDITEGTFKIGDAEFTIDSTTTLASLIDQINRSQTAYATAYWDTLSGTMVIQSTLTGASLINIEAGTSNFTDIMGFTTVTDTGASALVTSSQTLGKNAVIRINGTTVTATSNVITSDVSRIKGLTINLKDVSEGETVTITVEQDDEAIFNAVSDTIDAYNAMMEALNKELSDKSTLGNEALLKLMRNNLKRLMTSSLSGAYVFKNLAAIGISTGEAQDSITLDVTSLMIDKDTFMNALDTDSDAVKALLVGTQTNPGIFLQANNIVESSIKSSGYFSNMIDSLTRNIDRIEEKINKTNDEINKYRDRLERQFHNMELTISGLQNAYSAFLN